MYKYPSPKKRILVWFLLTALFGGILVACAPSTPEVITRVETQVVERVVTEIVTQVEERVITPTPPPEKPEGGTLIFGTGLRAEFPINPILGFHRPALWLFDALLEIDPDTSQPRPNLAESWEVSDDGLVYTFKLRQDVKWHDGEQFNADDVVFTFDRYLNDADSRAVSSFTYPVGEEQVPLQVEKVDDYTVRFTLPVSSSRFLDSLCCWNGIVPEHLLSQYEKMSDATEFNENPVGTGVLIFEELRPQEFVRFRMNKDYWRGRPALDEFVWRVIPDDDAQVTALANGEMDVMKNVTSEDVASRIAEIPGVTIYSVLGNFTHALFFNPEQYPPFQDLNVREAIAHAIDKPTIIPSVVGSTVPYADQIFPPGFWGYNPDARVLDYDPEVSTSLLAEAGWEDTNGDGIVDKDGQPLSFTVISESTLLPEAIQAYLLSVGVDMQIKQVERAVRNELQENGEWEAYIGWDGSGVAFQGLFSNWVSGTWTNYDNPDFDALVFQADSETDAEVRADLVKQAVKMMTDDVAAVWLYNYTTRIAVSDNIKGLQMPPTPADLNNTGVFYHLEDLYMLEPK